MIKKTLTIFLLWGFIYMLNSCGPNKEKDYNNGNENTLERLNVEENGWKGISFTTDFTRQNATIIGIEAGGFFQDILILPTTFQNIPITRIAENAFRNPSHADPNHRIIGINELNLSYMHYLVYIGENAFRGSIRRRPAVPGGFEPIQFGNIPNLRKIGDFAFADNQLNHMNFVNLQALYSIGNSAFENTGIVRINFHQLPNLKYIGSRAFYRHSLISIFNIYIEYLPLLKEIGDGAFTSPTMPRIRISNLPSLERIGVNAFSARRIPGLQMSNLPSLRRIENNAFRVEQQHPILLPIEDLNIDLSKSKYLTFIGMGAFSTDTNEIRNRYINY